MSVGQLLIVLALVTACGKPSAERTEVAKKAEPSATAPGTPAQQTSSPSDPEPRLMDEGSLGALRAEISGGTPAARQHFFRGLLALHSFWYEEATKEFEAAIAADPTFSMAYWGVAMSKAKLLWGDDDLAAGRAALTKMPAPNLLPPRDQAWAMAALSLYRKAKADVRTSRRDFVAVMEQLHAQFPDDESRLFLALGLLSTIQPDMPDELAIRKRAGALASEVFEHNPKHPGAAHYIIHAYDTPELAQLALPAAKLYATIAPAAFHALHMPAHIFARLGQWEPAMTSCQAAWDASVAWVKREQLAPDHQDFHSVTWLIEIGFERGRRADADRALKLFSDAVRGGLTHEKRAAYANQVASYLGRTGEWARVDELLAPLEAPATGAVATAQASSAACGAHAPLPSGPPTHLFERRAVLATRARAAAMLKDTAKLTQLLDERDRVDAEIRPFLVETQPADLVASGDKLRPLVRKALTAYAKGDDLALVAALRPLARDQDQEFIGEGTAGGILHQEQIAEALFRRGRFAEARAEFRAVLAKHAGRTRSLLGAARVATKLRDKAGARELYQQLLAHWSDADADTPGLDEARAAVAAAP